MTYSICYEDFNDNYHIPVDLTYFDPSLGSICYCKTKK